MERKGKHLEFIQGTVNRLSTNSFLLKGWSVVLVSALFALASADFNLYFIYLAWFPAIAFWILDGYFLWQERLFRRLYDHVRSLDEHDIDFSMDTSPFDRRDDFVGRGVLVEDAVHLPRSSARHRRRRHPARAQPGRVTPGRPSSGTATGISVWQRRR